MSEKTKAEAEKKEGGGKGMFNCCACHEIRSWLCHCAKLLHQNIMHENVNTHIFFIRN